MLFTSETPPTGGQGQGENLPNLCQPRLDHHIPTPECKQNLHARPPVSAAAAAPNPCVSQAPVSAAAVDPNPM